LKSTSPYRENGATGGGLRGNVLHEGRREMLSLERSKGTVVRQPNPASSLAQLPAEHLVVIFSPRARKCECFAHIQHSLSRIHEENVEVDSLLSGFVLGGQPGSTFGEGISRRGQPVSLGSASWVPRDELCPLRSGPAFHHQQLPRASLTPDHERPRRALQRRKLS